MVRFRVPPPTLPHPHEEAGSCAAPERAAVWTSVPVLGHACTNYFRCTSNRAQPRPAVPHVPPFLGLAGRTFHSACPFPPPQPSPAPMASLFSKVRLGALELPHRVLFAPCTRCRVDEGHVPKPIVAEYYRQRASAALERAAFLPWCRISVVSTLCVVKLRP